MVLGNVPALQAVLAVPGAGLGNLEPGQRTLLQKAPLYLSWSRWFSALCSAETPSSRGRSVWPRWAS